MKIEIYHQKPDWFLEISQLKIILETDYLFSFYTTFQN